MIAAQGSLSESLGVNLLVTRVAVMQIGAGTAVRHLIAPLVLAGDARALALDVLRHCPAKSRRKGPLSAAERRFTVEWWSFTGDDLLWNTNAA